MSEAPVRVPIDISELRHEDGAITHLLVRSLALAIAGTRNLPSEGPLLWDPAKPQRRQVNRRSYQAHDAVLLFLHQIKEVVMGEPPPAGVLMMEMRRPSAL